VKAKSWKYQAVCKRSQDYNTLFTTPHRTVSVYGGRCGTYGYAEAVPVLQVPGNKADAVHCKSLQQIRLLRSESGIYLWMEGSGSGALHRVNADSLSISYYLELHDPICFGK
jgi:hypothetical protein